MKTRSLTTVAALGLSAIGLSGCMTAHIEQSRHTLTGVGDGDAIVILARSYHNGNFTENDFIDCVDKNLSKGDSGLTVIPDGEFRDAFYPWFEPRTAPRSPNDLPKLLADEQVAAKFADTGVRYIIWIEGSTEALEGGGSISCSVGPGAGGCFGLMWWEKDSDYEAAIWDMKRVASAGMVATDVNGMSIMPAVVIPVPLIAPTQNTACKRLSDQLRMFLVEGVS
ncbi:MAG: hypothetical protein JSW21_01170 [Gammaproteobacteria bacterium]|nr:MAG: hypothetical protein JSW21_01170 [Gammaproteobacteria bacterium]